jgi:quercetin dioxygenase-like cupin family protein
METANLAAAAGQQMRLARDSKSGRAARTIFGGSGGSLRHTVVALTAGATLAEHENPGEATVLVLEGRVRLVSPEADWSGREGDLLVVPQSRHSLQALTDATVLLTVAKSSRKPGGWSTAGSPR